MSDHIAPAAVGEDTIKSQREKFDQYRQWMKQQQQTLNTTGAATAEMARRLEGANQNQNQQQPQQHETAYARRNRSPDSPNGTGGGGHLVGAHNSQRGAANSGRLLGSPPSPYDQNGQVIYSSPPGAPRPSWMNTKVGSTNQRSQIPPEQLAKFMPPPPPADDHSGYCNDPLNVYSRSELWQRRKKQKMDEAREIKEQVMDMECTFTPQTHANEFFAQSTARGERGTSAGDAAAVHASAARSTSLAESKQYGGGYTVTGVEGFLQRLQKAREDAAFKGARLRSKEQFAWKNETTTPDPFELGRKRATRIRALKQPFTAAPGAFQQAMRNDHTAPASNLFAPLEGVLPRGVFSGVTAAEIVDSAVLRSGAASTSHSPGLNRR